VLFISIPVSVKVQYGHALTFHARRSAQLLAIPITKLLTDIFLTFTANASILLPRTVAAPSYLGKTMSVTIVVLLKTSIANTLICLCS